MNKPRKSSIAAIGAGVCAALALPAAPAMAGERTERAIIGALIGGVAGAAVSKGDGAGALIGAAAGAAIGSATASDHDRRNYRRYPSVRRDYRSDSRQQAYGRYYGDGYARYYGDGYGRYYGDRYSGYDYRR